MDIRDYAKKTYTFLLKDDSLLATLSFVGVSLLFIWFIFFPFLTLITGTELPIVVVISESMVHTDSWEEQVARCETGICTQREYYEERSMWTSFSSYPLRNGLNRGDIILSVHTSNLEVGDVVIFNSEQSPYPIIHRIVDENNGTYTTKGDNNAAPNPSIGETSLTSKDIIANAKIRIPYIGYVKLVTVDTLLYIRGLVS